MYQFVVLLIEKELDDQVVICDSTTDRFFFLFFETIDHLHIIFIIWRGCWSWRVWWTYEIRIQFERENFWVCKVVGIACSLQWQTWSSSVIYRKLSQNWLRSVRILESMRHCFVKSVQNRLRSVRILESMCQCIVKSFQFIVKSVQNWKTWESWKQCVIVLSNPFRIDWKTWESLN